jgi:hypothetical protein
VAGRHLDLGSDGITRVDEYSAGDELADRGAHAHAIDLSARAEFAGHHLAVVVERAGVEELLDERGRFRPVGVGKARGVLAEKRPRRTAAVLRHEHRKEEPRDVRELREPGSLLVQRCEQFALGPACDLVGYFLPPELLGAPECSGRLGVAEPVGLLVPAGEQREIAVVHREAMSRPPAGTVESRRDRPRADVVLERFQYPIANAPVAPGLGRVPKAKRSCHGVDTNSGTGGHTSWLRWFEERVSRSIDGLPSRGSEPVSVIPTVAMPVGGRRVSRSERRETNRFTLPETYA